MADPVFIIAVDREIVPESDITLAIGKDVSVVHWKGQRQISIKDELDGQLVLLNVTEIYYIAEWLKRKEARRGA